MYSYNTIILNTITNFIRHLPNEGFDVSFEYEDGDKGYSDVCSHDEALLDIQLAQDNVDISFIIDSRTIARASFYEGEWTLFEVGVNI